MTEVTVTTNEQEKEIQQPDKPAQIVQIPKINKAYLLAKRVFDVFSALIGLIIASPLFLIIAVLIKCDDGGKVFYLHNRVGKNGRTIRLVKFRTMVENADEVFNSFSQEMKDEFYKSYKLQVDPRVTKVGKLLRKTSLDELPQLVNILTGSLSVVGPRPVVVAELEKYGEFADKYLSVTPGLTGHWQVKGRSTTSYEERVEMDMYYIDNCSAWLDLKIMLQTVKAVFTKNGAC